LGRGGACDHVRNKEIARARRQPRMLGEGSAGADCPGSAFKRSTLTLTRREASRSPPVGTVLGTAPAVTAFCVTAAAEEGRLATASYETETPPSLVVGRLSQRRRCGLPRRA
jgi:hypothetical protein